MYFQEKIETLKKIFKSSDFKVPFTDAAGILKQIEKHFIIQKNVETDLNNMSQYHNQWAANIRQKIELRLGYLHYMQYLEKLDSETNYWVVLAFEAKHQAFDCKPKVMQSLILAGKTDFFVIDKKYNWFTYFALDTEGNLHKAYKSGSEKTPFE
jgi:hypothetical protein